MKYHIPEPFSPLQTSPIVDNNNKTTNNMIATGVVVWNGAHN